MLGRQHAGGTPGGAAEDVLDQPVAIEGEGDRLADAAVRQARVAEVEGEIGEARPRTPAHRERRMGLEVRQQLGLGRVLGELEAAALELEDADQLVGDDAEHDRGQLRRPVGPCRVGLQHDPVAAIDPYKTERSRADGRLARCPGERGGEDAEAGRVEQRGERSAQAHDHRRRVRGLDCRDHREGAPLGGCDGRVQYTFVRCLHIVCGDGVAVGEAQVGAQPKDDRGRVGEAPRRRELRSPSPGVVGPREGDVEQIAQPTGRRVEAEAGIEALRVGVDGDHEAAGGRRSVAARPLRRGRSGPPEGGFV